MRKKFRKRKVPKTILYRKKALVVEGRRGRRGLPWDEEGS